MRQLLAEYGVPYFLKIDIEVFIVIDGLLQRTGIKAG